jgi:hypothetical protein
MGERLNAKTRKMQRRKAMKSSPIHEVEKETATAREEIKRIAREHGWELVEIKFKPMSEELKEK